MNVLALEIATMTDPAEQYRELVDCNGHVQNMVLRRLSGEQLVALGDYAAQQPPLPFSSTDVIQLAVAKEKRRR